MREDPASVSKRNPRAYFECSKLLTGFWVLVVMHGA